MAQRGVNKVIIVGNLGQDPDLRHTASGTAVCNISVATSESWKDKSTGQEQERTEWHRVVLWDKLAEIASQYLTKGSKVYIEGALQTRKWTDQNQVEKYSTEIVVKGFNGTLQMLDSKTGNVGGQQQSSPVQKQTEQKSDTAKQAPQNFDGFDDDIPF